MSDEILSPEELSLKPIKDLDSKTELNTKNFYRVRKGEIFRYIDNHLYSGLIKIGEEPSGYEDELFNLKIPKIPHEFIKRIIDFFKLVYTEHEAEAIILLWYNFDTNEWEAEIPEQVVGGGSAKYERDLKESTKLEKRGYTLVGSIHSHATMTAFHSSTDDDDEFKFDGIHITVGHVTTRLEFACRFITKDVSYKLEPEDCLEWVPEKLNVPESWKKKVNTKKVSYNQTRNLSDNTWWNQCEV